MIEKAIVAALEPVLENVVALEKRMHAVEGRAPLAGPQGVKGDQGDKGDKGDQGERGIDGCNGAGIDAPLWEAGEVYRKGVHVIAYLGQHYVATKDTAATPGDSDHWQRIGASGFRHRGAFDEAASYVDGDLYTKDFGTFYVNNGDHVLLAGRGEKGERGYKGERGAKGENGRDGSTIIAAQADAQFKLVLVQQNADGSIDHLEADFAPAFRELIHDALKDAMPELAATLAELREDIDALLAQRRRA